MRKRFFHPRSWLRRVLTYSRFVGEIKPELLRGTEPERAARILCQDIFWRSTTLEVPIGRRLLVLCPHPDDEAIGCGGLLLLHKGRADIRIVNIFSGDGGGRLTSKGSFTLEEQRAVLAGERGRELARVGELLGASDVVSFGVSEFNDQLGSDHVAWLKKLLEDFEPDVVLLPWFLDSHRHHRAVNELFANAARNHEAIVIAYEVWSLLQPNAILDVTSVIEQKLMLVSQYRTQLDEVDYISYVKGLARVRAVQKGAGAVRKNGFVEAYMVLPSGDYCDIVKSLERVYR